MDRSPERRHPLSTAVLRPGEVYSVWAPAAEAVGLVVGSPDADPVPMTPAGDGWWTSDVVAEAGTDYGFRLTDSGGHTGEARADPRSARQPDGVHGLSRVHGLDPAGWTDSAWTGRPLEGSVIYEMHVGTFSADGTLRSAIAHLDELVELGVEIVEVLPVNAFNGEYGWGYDGVLWFAVHEPYGGPDAVQEFVDACHARGLAVCLDVVYNHLGPSGNHLPEFGPYIRPGGSVWGDGLNLDGEGSGEVRRYVIDNALRWFEEFHVDALRLDAVHALHDSSALHVLEELAVATERMAAHLGRPLSLVAESDLNDPRLVTSRDGGGYGLTAQWDDDVHHAIHAAVSGERQGYYADFGSPETLRRALEGAFVHDGTYSSFRGRAHGRPVDRDRTPASRFVAYTLTHDQVGNRAGGDRPSMRLTPDQQLLKAALVLCSPFTPMLFQGEEWGAGTPWAFFTSHPEPELGEAVRQGRTREFAAMGWDPDEVADPQDPETFTRSKLDRGELARSPHREIREGYRALLALRREHAALTDPSLLSVAARTSDAGEDDRWIVVRRGDLELVANLGDRPCRVPASGEALWSNAAAVTDEGVDCEPYGCALVRRPAGA